MGKKPESQTGKQLEGSRNSRRDGWDGDVAEVTRVSQLQRLEHRCGWVNVRQPRTTREAQLQLGRLVLSLCAPWPQ